MLAPYSDRVSVVSTKVGEDGDEHVDVTLYDTFGLAQVDGEDLRRSYSICATPTRSPPVASFR